MTLGFELTDDQIQAIQSNSNMVITACPGSGKTTIVAEKIRNELDLLNSYQGIVGITFTVKASNELRKRCSRNGFNIKSSFFGTIDNFCLKEIIYPFASKIFGYKAGEIECVKYQDLSNDYQMELPDLNVSGVNLATADYDRYHQLFSRLYHNGLILLEAAGIMANHIVSESLACQRYISAKYSSIYVDEYQDSSEPQHQLFLNLLNLGLKAVAVGDIQQSIYAWRGSSTEYINDLISRNDIFEHHIVNINHRCHPSITNYANRLFNPTSSLIDADETRVFQRLFNGTQRDLAEALNNYIPETANIFGIVDNSNIAILVKANRSLDYLHEMLTIPYRIYSDDALDVINTKNTSLFQDLIRYHFDESIHISDISGFNKIFDELSRLELEEIISMIRNLRSCDRNDLRDAIINIAQSIQNQSIQDNERNALNDVINIDSFFDNYRPKSPNEVQVMTLHKSKGLEFEVVFHLDLYEWVLPYRSYTGNFDDAPEYPNLEQDLNLHYVGITRAKSACILAYSTRRINGSGHNRKGEASCFLTLDGLIGLYD